MEVFLCRPYPSTPGLGCGFILGRRSGTWLARNQDMGLAGSHSCMGFLCPCCSVCRWDPLFWLHRFSLESYRPLFWLPFWEPYGFICSRGWFSGQGNGSRGRGVFWPCALQYPGLIYRGFYLLWGHCFSSLFSRTSYFLA